MKTVFNSFLNKMTRNGLIKDNHALMGLADAYLEWNRPDDPACEKLAPLFDHMNISALIFARPAEPYWKIISYLAETTVGPIAPSDCETRTFLHELPVADKLSPEKLIPLLRRRKAVIVKNHGIVTYGTVSLEQPFVTFSSVCFACFVKFFSDMLSETTSGKIRPDRKLAFESVVSLLPDLLESGNDLARGPFDSQADVISAICEAGGRVVDLNLVDSSFGNISYCASQILYISQTGSFLDDLAGCIDPCPLDGSSCAGITASSELSAHMRIIKDTGCRAILHGHPKFSVILSMDCDNLSCQHRGNCHKICPCDRDVCGIPVVSGEVGAGPHGLCHTVPSALKNQTGVIVYGHGVFTTDDTDFNGALHKLVDIETQCRIEYFKRIGD